MQKEISQLQKTFSKIQKEPRQTKISKPFINVLAIVSIFGFTSIITQSIFNIEINPYLEPLWLTILGIGFIAESAPRTLFKTIRNQLTEKNFASITTFIIGTLAIISGIFSVPGLEIQNPIFPATRGIISIIAIIFIIIQTWVIK